MAEQNGRGIFITLEGVDGCGKSTKGRYLAEELTAAGREVVSLRDPGSTEISERIRAILLDPEVEGMVHECELMLFEAARAQLTREVIMPALERGAVVVCDRFFDSTYGYQYGGRGLSEQLVKTCNELGSCGVVPARTIVFDLAPECALQRATKGGADRIEAEGLAFQQRIREAYLRLAAQEPQRVHLVDAVGTPEEVFARLADALRDLFGTLEGGEA